MKLTYVSTSCLRDAPARTIGLDERMVECLDRCERFASEHNVELLLRRLAKHRDRAAKPGWLEMFSSDPPGTVLWLVECECVHPLSLLHAYFVFLNVSHLDGALATTSKLGRLERVTYGAISA